MVAPDAMNALQRHLQTLGPGRIAEVAMLQRLLHDCWDQFDGGGSGGMAAYKPLNRIEHAVWTPPVLAFRIERHGGAVLGSTRGELQRWELDLDKRSACCSPAGRRQLTPMQQRLDTVPIAEEVIRAISEKREDSRLKWYPDGRVCVLVGTILPSGSAPKQTLEGRRRRLRRKLEQRLTLIGWSQVPGAQPYTYERAATGTGP